MPRTSYAIAIGSNRRGRHGSPAAEVRAAMTALKHVRAASPIIASAPLGAAQRRFANAVVVVESKHDPEQMLARLKAIEVDFGRRHGRRWGDRVIDLDIVLWSGGSWVGRDLVVPHREFRVRAFVLAPLAAIAPDWRDPLTGLAIRQLAYRLRHG